MGPNVKPQFDEEDKNQHIETVIEVNWLCVLTVR